MLKTHIKTCVSEEMDLAWRGLRFVKGYRGYLSTGEARSLESDL